MTARLKRLIHVGCKELGLDEDLRHALQVQVTGKSSLSQMTEPELRLVVDALKTKGFVVKTTARRRTKPAPRADLRLIHVLWAKLGEAGELRDGSRRALNAFIRVRFEGTWNSVPADIDMLRDHKQIDAVIQALKAWGKRAEIDFDWDRLQ